MDMSDYYIIIPPEVRADPDLRPIDKLIMGEILTLSKNSGQCWASNAYLAKIYHVSIRNIGQSIKNLSDRGLIHVGYVSKNLSTQRTITPTQKLTIGLQNLQGGHEKSAHPPTQNLRTNNTRVNNTSIIANEADVIAFFREKNQTESEAKKFFHYYDALGWTIGENPIRNWRSLASKWISSIKPQPKIKLLT